MSDIVDGLRGRAGRYRQLWGNAAYYTEGDALFDEKAADRIEQLEAALRELLEADDNLRELMPRWVSEALIEGALIRVRTAKDKARAALEERT